MRIWLHQHRMALAQAAARLMAQKAATLASVSAIGIALALPLGGYTFLEPLRTLAGRVALEPKITLYVRPEAARSDTLALAKVLGKDARIASTQLVTREVALRQLGEREGFADIVASLETNPLPDAFVIRPRETGADAIDRLATDLRGLPNVLRVHSDTLWATRLAALAALGRLVLVFLAALLAFGLIAVTFNTIRLQILTLREEIEVSKLLGATDAFIRRPYYYLGALQGALGGVVALGVVWLGVYLLNREIQVLAETYGASYRIPTPLSRDAASAVFYAGVLGWLGAHLSVSRHLREIEPS